MNKLLQQAFTADFKELAVRRPRMLKATAEKAGSMNHWLEAEKPRRFRLAHEPSAGLSRTLTRGWKVTYPLLKRLPSQDLGRSEFTALVPIRQTVAGLAQDYTNDVRSGKLGAGGDVRVQEALQYIAADCDRDEWVQVGMAINSEFGDPDFCSINQLSH